MDMCLWLTRLCSRPGRYRIRGYNSGSELYASPRATRSSHQAPDRPGPAEPTRKKARLQRPGTDGGRAPRRGNLLRAGPCPGSVQVTRGRGRRGERTQVSAGRAPGCCSLGSSPEGTGGPALSAQASQQLSTCGPGRCPAGLQASVAAGSVTVPGRRQVSSR